MRSIGAIGVVLATFSIVGCGSSPPSQFYTLASVPAAAASEPSDISAPSLTLGRLSLPSILDRPEIATRVSATRLEYSEVRRWAAPLDKLVRQALTDDLAARTGRPAARTASAPIVVVLEISQFDANPSGTVTLDARWAVASTDQKTPIPLTEHADLQLQPNAGAEDNVAATMSQALAMLADKIVAQLPPRPR